MISDYSMCATGYEPCENMTFTSGTFEAIYHHEKVLDAGIGCWIFMNRWVNGSWGQV